jgi:hypothetical protein
MHIAMEKERVLLTGEKATYLFSRETGCLLSVRAGGREYPMEGIRVDVGADGVYARNLLQFDCLDGKNTWELPAISPTGAGDAAVFEGLHVIDGLLEGVYTCGRVRIRQRYDLCGDNLRVSAKVENISKEKITINGTAYLTSRKMADTVFEFPTNVPSSEFSAADLQPFQAISCGLVGSMTHMKDTSGDMNVLFLDTVEKWSQGVYRAEDTIVCAYVAAVECWLLPSESLDCGYLYVQPVMEGDPYLAIRDFFDSLGYHAATDGIREGVLYSCHPHGTMDNNFKRSKDLWEYAKELDDIKALGANHVWVLPVFEHLDRGVYHPTDQSIIDARYGGEEAMRAFADRAHELGLTVLFDYVPHGPAPDDTLAREKDHWCSRRRDLTLQDEWHCVSFDMTNPDYLRYTSDLVNSHVRRFDIDGARIDCAMGGLSNWTPYGNHRPSASNLSGGVAISKAIKQGFQEMGKKALNMPENFNPVPAYYPVTDLFYGMNLYRVLVELDKRREDAAYFVRELTRFLSIEHRAMPKEMKKLRFLGNHDTVSWVWQSKRAYEVYGGDRAKALFALMAFLDGIPFLYQGDEDPGLAGKEGPVLRDFFRDLYKARRDYIGEGTDITHLNTGCGVMAFVRNADGADRLVLVSLSDQAETVSMEELKGARSLLGTLEAKDGKATVPSYAFDIFELE